VLDLRLQRAEQGGHSDWAAVRADLAELSRVVSGLLTLSRADRSGAFRGETEINLTRLAREAAAAFSPRLEAEGRRIEVEAPDDPLRLNGEAGELKEMLYALIDNALTHGAGRVLISLAADGPVIVLTVGDEGAGVVDGETMFERFHKGDGASPGAGLGLAIVRQTARGHGGEARFVAPAVVEVQLAGLG
jgi:two-component system sensor histidine kinase QseC